MKIILTEDVSPKKKWVAGTEQDWPRATINAISEKRGDNEWYCLSEEIAQAANCKQIQVAKRAKKAA